MGMGGEAESVFVNLVLEASLPRHSEPEVLR